MLLKLILVSLAIASATAQKCVMGAQPDGNGGCRCADGLEGDPNLCCYFPGSNRACWVAGDPVLTSFTGNKVGLDFPCGTMITSSRMDSNNPLVNVFAAGKEVTSGTIYTSQVKVEFTQNAASLSLTFNFDQSPFQVQVERNNEQAETFTLGNGDVNRLDQAGVLGDIVVMYDAELSMFYVMGGGMQINVKPASGNDAEQATPGVCLIEPKGSEAPTSAVAYACSLNVNVLNTPGYLDTAIQPMKNYMFNNGVLKDTTDPEYAGKCQAYQNTIVNNCNAADRFNAMKKCAFVMFQPLIRRCFYETGIGSGRVMNGFLYCLDTYCQGTKALCDGLKSDPRFSACAPNLLDCEIWAPYRRVNSYVAGEGGGVNFGNEGEENQNPQETTAFDIGSLDILGSGGTNQENGGAGGVGGQGWNPGAL